MNDNCPNCQQQASLIAELNRGTQASHLYQCAGCGHIWSTNRDLPAYGQEAA